jgi:hypothetical protein
MKTLFLLSILLPIGCVCCTHETTITFNSEPPGARIYYGSQFCGEAPTTRFWDADCVQCQQGCMGIWTAFWEGGARTSLPVMLRPGPDGFNDMHYEVLFVMGNEIAALPPQQ